MKLTDALEQLGQPVAYYPSLARPLGGCKAAILVCQLFYWQQRSTTGWTFRTADELEHDTGLSYEEQRSARRHLVGLEILDEDYRRLEHRLYFRLNLDRLNDVWSNWQLANPAKPDSRNGKSPFRGLGEVQFGDLAKSNSKIETTVETKEEIKKEENYRSVPDVRDGLDAPVDFSAKKTTSDEGLSPTGSTAKPSPTVLIGEANPGEELAPSLTRVAPAPPCSEQPPAPPALNKRGDKYCPPFTPEGLAADRTVYPNAHRFLDEFDRICRERFSDIKMFKRNARDREFAEFCRKKAGQTGEPLDWVLSEYFKSFDHRATTKRLTVMEFEAWLDTVEFADEDEAAA